MTDQVTKLEEQVAHLERICEDLSAMVAKQGAEIERLTRHTQMLMAREADREAAVHAAASALTSSAVTVVRTNAASASCARP